MSARLFAAISFLAASHVACGVKELPSWEAEADFRYNDFMRWVSENKQQIAAQSGKFEAHEIPEEFDIDKASTSKMYEGHLRPEVVEMAKTIDKWEYTKFAWMTGDLFVLSSTPLHLFIMSKLMDFAGKGKTFVDAGCGSGYLLLFWHKLCSNKTAPESAACKAIGLEFNSDLAEDARRIARTHPQVPRSDGSQTEIFTEDILNLSTDALSYMQSTDVIYVSPAVWALRDLEALARVLRIDGVMLANLCTERIEGESDKCKARFAFYRKKQSGGIESLEEDVSDGSDGIVHTAVTASKPPTSASMGQSDVKVVDVRVSGKIDVSVSPHSYESSFLGRSSGVR
eukprot:TRINITY_DN65834_c0_g1_i1.p1 TRINITY_DN65834_c0_g1~~TRINITY_DN65834_c0_g1_i1.p1  ORF type:complete len:342 (-),score=58.71 TRINITY_DN65834_c0_g1_i1:14-1039(-)